MDGTAIRLMGGTGVCGGRTRCGLDRWHIREPFAYRIPFSNAERFRGSQAHSDRRSAGFAALAGRSPAFRIEQSPLP